MDTAAQSPGQGLPDNLSDQAAAHTPSFTLISTGLACGAFFWLAASANDWLAGVAAGLFLAALILRLRKDMAMHKLIPTRWWTRKCDGHCGDTSAHDSHLTRFGRWALGLR